MIKPSQFKTELAQAISAAAQTLDAPADLPALNPDKLLERPRADGHGDLSCPLALILAKPLRQKPAHIAEQLLAALQPPPFIADTQIAAPGFINFTLAAAAKTQVINEILTAGSAYGTHPARAETFLVEFVSANPTGPLHVGHGRACAYGDALANLLAAAGATVKREYYVNDAGRQMDILTASVWLRHWNDKDTPMPDGTYRGDYLADVIDKLAAPLKKTAPPEKTLLNDMQQAADSDQAANRLVQAARAALGTADTYTDLRRQIGDIMLDGIIKKDMETLNVDTAAINFFSEAQLFNSDRVNKTIDDLPANTLYEKDGALWFAASTYGDEKDRVVRRASGEPTYFAADIAYHADKLSRPRPSAHDYKIINVLGADHHGYVPRLRAAIQALGFAADSMEVEIIQFVTLLEQGERLKMSTREGTFTTLRQLVEAVGSEAARYYYLNRKNDQHLDFDIAVARAQERANPIYYLQYANARIERVLENWNGDRSALANIATTDTATLTEDSGAVELCAALLRYPELVRSAANERAPHLLTHYLHQVAALLHNFYEHTRILPPADAEPAPGMDARLALLAATATVLTNGATLLGLHLPKKL